MLCLRSAEKRQPKLSRIITEVTSLPQGHHQVCPGISGSQNKMEYGTGPKGTDTVNDL